MYIKLAITFVIIVIIGIFLRNKAKNIPIIVSIIDSFKFLLSAMLSFVFIAMTLKDIYAYLTYPSYDAKITKIETYVKNDMNIYTPIYSFYSEKGSQLVQDSTSSSTKINVGDIVKIKYKNGYLIKDSFNLFLLNIFIFYAMIGLLLIALYYIIKVFNITIENKFIVFQIWLFFGVILLMLAIIYTLSYEFYISWISDAHTPTAKYVGLGVIIFLILLILIGIILQIIKSSTTKKTTKKITPKKKNKYIEIKDESKLQIYGTLFFLISFSIITIVVIINGNNIPIVIGFTIIIAITLYKLINLIINLKKFGNISLIIDSDSTKVNKNLKGYFSIHEANVNDNNHYIIELKSTKKKLQKNSSNGTDSKNVTVWSSKTIGEIKKDSGYYLIHFKIYIDNFGDIDHSNNWFLKLHSDIEGVDLQRNFILDIEF